MTGSIHLLRNALALCAGIAAIAATEGCRKTYTDPDISSLTQGFVRVVDGQFEVTGKPYCFVGTNFWYGAYLGSASEYGDRDRLESELDLMQAHGVINLRVLGASETSPHRDSLDYTFRDRSPNYNEKLLVGMDVLLDELARRDMKAVLYLNNFWEWSGGMSTYLSWVNGGAIVDPSDPSHRWPAFADFAAGFYGNDAANALFRDYVRHLVSRTNTVNGKRYIDDPTIMAWQLANEPRPGFRNELGFRRLPSFYDWVSSTALFIKSLDPNHLVSTGSEGTVGCLQDDDCYLSAHSLDGIDYMTFHMWPKNWGWIEADDMEGSIDRTISRANAYMDKHLKFAEESDLPIVLEEFGLERDGGSVSPESSSKYRELFFETIFSRVESSLARGGTFAGTNFWTWGGTGRAQHEDYRWRRGDTRFTGDPPQEAQGLNSVFDSDTATLDLIGRHAARLDAMDCGRAVRNTDG